MTESTPTPPPSDDPLARIGILISSTRPNRIGHHVADWVTELAPDDVEARALDLARIGLPLLDEPDLPANGNYAQPHTRAWSELIMGIDGLIIVTGEYNAGYPAPLKNAIDYLWAEWRDLPVGCVGYGWGGARKAIAALDQTLERLNMKVLRPVCLEFGNDLTERGEIGVPNPAPEEAVRTLYSQLIAAGSPRGAGS
ncbi:NAD(P)H-dependent oxidoreductase [Naumannella cuiyingiana]|uniref:NAD(P)H-dependent FMN reductase n=1 Tax=Naumannella cuiyingiana TaxID=1347891 RepID=A0A7Z0IM31_9ACTN|nr:NAD(P)H-dependent FMN reductase [Naumannella cuiyingiana]